MVVMTSLGLGSMFALSLLFDPHPFNDMGFIWIVVGYLIVAVASTYLMVRLFVKSDRFVERLMWRT
jgi:hypothetical protein